MEKLSPKESVEGANAVLRVSVRAPKGFSEGKPEAAKPRGRSPEVLQLRVCPFAAAQWREGEGGEEAEEGGAEGEGAGQAPTGLDQAHRNKSKQDTSKMRPNILAEPKSIFFSLP